MVEAMNSRWNAPVWKVLGRIVDFISYLLMFASVFWMVRYSIQNKNLFTAFCSLLMAATCILVVITNRQYKRKHRKG